MIVTLATQIIFRGIMEIILGKRWKRITMSNLMVSLPLCERWDSSYILFLVVILAVIFCLLFLEKARLEEEYMPSEQKPSDRIVIPAFMCRRSVQRSFIQWWERLGLALFFFCPHPSEPIPQQKRFWDGRHRHGSVWVNLFHRRQRKYCRRRGIAAFIIVCLRVDWDSRTVRAGDPSYYRSGFWSRQLPEYYRTVRRTAKSKINNCKSCDILKWKVLLFRERAVPDKNAAAYVAEKLLISVTKNYIIPRRKTKWTKSYQRTLWSNGSLQLPRLWAEGRRRFTGEDRTCWQISRQRVLWDRSSFL